MLKKFLKPTTLTNRVNLAILLVRLGFGGLLAMHGYDKLQTFIAGDHDFPDPFHVSPIVSQGLTIFAEFFCSLLLIIGLFSRLASFVLIICMVTIAFMIHGKDPFGDKEHALLYLIGFLVIFLLGPGKYSVDARLYK